MTARNSLVRMGLQIPNFTYPGVGPDDLFERIALIATTAEASGFDSVWVMDHFYQLPMLGKPEQEMFGPDVAVAKPGRLLGGKGEDPLGLARKWQIDRA